MMARRLCGCHKVSCIHSTPFNGDAFNVEWQRQAHACVKDFITHITLLLNYSVYYLRQHIHALHIGSLRLDTRLIESVVVLWQHWGEAKLSTRQCPVWPCDHKICNCYFRKQWNSRTTTQSRSKLNFLTPHNAIERIHRESEGKWQTGSRSAAIPIRMNNTSRTHLIQF